MEEASTPVEVWPDCQTSFNVFVGMATQWNRAGMDGSVVGLNYVSIEPVLRLIQVPSDVWPQVFDDLRIMEDAALAHIRSQKKDK